MKVCHVITRMIVGGAQENTLYSCQGLLEHGHDVTLVTGPSPGPEGKLLSQNCPKGLRIVEIPDLVRQVSPWHDIRAYHALKRHFLQEKYDVVHTHASKAGILGRIAARKAGVPFVAHTVHGQPFFKDQNPLLNFAFRTAERIAARYCDRIYAVAQAMIDQCVNAKVAPRELYKVVYSGMDIRAFADATPDPALRERLGIPEGAPVIGTVARLFPLKGHETIIDAAPAVLRRFPETRFLFIGNGILKEKLEAKIARLGIADHFIFTGLVPPDQVARYIPLMTVMAHLSLREGLPRAVVQALACGVPVVAYPLDGTPEVVHDGETGLLVPREDPADVAQALLTLLEAPEKARGMGRLGQQQVIQAFDWRLMANTLEEEYLRYLPRPISNTGALT